MRERPLIMQALRWDGACSAATYRGRGADGPHPPKIKKIKGSAIISRAKRIEEEKGRY